MSTYKLLKALPNYAIGKTVSWSTQKNAYVNDDPTTDNYPVTLGKNTVQGDITWFQYQIAPDITAAIDLLQNAGYTVTGGNQ